jgi:hypothetical protein
MATTTYEPIVSYTLPSNAATVTLGSGGQGTIPTTYTDLVLVVNGSITAGGENFLIQFNGDTASNYSDTRVGGNGSSAFSTRTSSQTSMIAANIYSGQGTIIFQIQNYSNTTTFKTLLSRVSYASNLVSSHVGLWRKTPEAITSIKMFLSGENFTSGTTFTLYGIANAAIGAPKAQGGIITYDSEYFYHTFGASGTFTPQQSLTADVLVVAGGGGAGRGGGGAGGLLGFAAQSLSATNYTITVGAGGSGRTSDSPGLATKGFNSQFGGLTAAEGGGAGAGYSVNGGNGGSGGGAGWGGGVYSGGTGTSGQGNNGGNNGAGNNSGAGGGAGAVGGNGLTTTGGPGTGGNGVNTYSSWGFATGTGENVSGAVWYSGGGGGGSSNDIPDPGNNGGFGGGGRGNSLTTPSGNGLVNSGGGGGGGFANSTTTFGGSGGSGVVIIRYLKA